MTWIFPASECFPSPNRNGGRRGVEPDVLCLHYAVDGDDTEDMPDEQPSLIFAPREAPHDCMDVARLFARRSRNASAQFCIGRDGSKVQCVSLDDTAWHAGGGAFPDNGIGPLEQPRPGHFNRRSVGIEISNAGWAVERLKIPQERRSAPLRHRAGGKPQQWELYTPEAISTLEYTVAQIVLAMPGRLRWVCGHEDVRHRDVGGSKVDPGPVFPWEAIDWAAYGLTRVRYDFEKRAWVEAPPVDEDDHAGAEL